MRRLWVRFKYFLFRSDSKIERGIGSAFQPAMPQGFGRKWGTGCLNGERIVLTFDYPVPSTYTVIRVKQFEAKIYIYIYIYKSYIKNTICKSFLSI